MIALIPTATLSLLSMLAVAAGPGSTEAKAGPARARTVALQIDGAKLRDDQIATAAEDTEIFVRSDSTKALTGAHEVEVVADAAAPVIVVRLSWKSYADSIYGVQIEAKRPGQPAQLVESFECECGNSELAAAINERLPAALELLEEPKPEAADPVAEPDPTEAITEPDPHASDRTPRKRLGPLGGAGIGLGVAGAGMLVGGGILFAQGERFDPPSGRLEERDGQNFKPPGIALMVSGGAVLVTGAVLLILDRRKASKSASAVLLPSPGGLVLTGRF